MSNYFVKCNKSEVCKVTSLQCHHSDIHTHDGDKSICFEDFKCPDANFETCICESVSYEKAGLEKVD